MRTLLTSTFALLAVLGLSTLALARGTADVSQTVHNMSASAATVNPFYFTDEPEVCIFCHTPHGGSNTGPLWNRANPTPAGGFVMYSSATLSAAATVLPADINNESLLCLSCHDGSISVNHLLNFGQTNPIYTDNTGDPDTTVVGTPGVNKRIGGSPANPGDEGQLADDHPISFSYQAVYNEYFGAGKAGLYDPAGGLIPTDIRFFGGAALNVECSTCHDPHVDYNAEPQYAPFLNMSNAGSALCLGCHNK